MQKNKLLFIGGAAVVGAAIVLFALRPPAAPSKEITSAPIEENSTQGILLFKVTPENSEAEFNIFEVLRGEDKIVVGVTNQIAGEILLNLNEPEKSQVGEFKVNARTLKTDSVQRDGAISRLILKSSDAANEFITFTPKILSNLPKMIKLGDSFSVAINGDLSVSGVTKPAIFKGTLTLNNGGAMLSGNAEAKISRKDFSLVVPDFPFLADVGDEVTLKIKFSVSN